MNATNTNGRANEGDERDQVGGHGAAFDGSAALRIDDDRPIETEVHMKERDERGKEELADEVRQLGRRVTPEELERKGVRKLRQFSLADLNDLVARTVDRVLADRSGDEADTSRNTVVERTHAALAERAANDPEVRIELLERRLNKLADALDRSEHALAEVLDDVEAGLPIARRYVDALPDNHPLRRRGGSLRPRRALAGRTRSRRPAPTPEEEERVAERRSMLRALAEVNRMDAAHEEAELREEQREASEAPSRSTDEAAHEAAPESESRRDPEAVRRELEALFPKNVSADESERIDPRANPLDEVRDARRDENAARSSAPVSRFDEVEPENLRLKMEIARPHKGFGWRAGRRPLN